MLRHEGTNAKGQHFVSGEQVRFKGLPYDLLDYNGKIMTINHFYIHKSKMGEYFRVSLKEVDWYAYEEEIEKVAPSLSMNQKTMSLPSF